MKKQILNFILLGILLAILAYMTLPFTILRQSEINRGEELIENIEKFKGFTGRLPKNNEWAILKKIGFTNEEINAAQPSYKQLDKDHYQLIYVTDFDPPYLYWDSKKNEWQVGTP